RYQSGADLAMALRSYKIISVQEPRPVSAPLISPSAAGGSTRPVQAAAPAPRTGTAASSVVAKTNGSSTRSGGPSATGTGPSASKTSAEQAVTEVMKITPVVVPAKRASNRIPLIALVAIAVLIVLGGVAKVLRNRPRTTPAPAAVPSVPQPGSTASPEQSSS